MLIVALPAPVRLLVNMYESEPEIEVLNKDNFDSVVYGSDKASFVEFYAHWYAFHLIVVLVEIFQ